MKLGKSQSLGVQTLSIYYQAQSEFKLQMDWTNTIKNKIWVQKGEVKKNLTKYSAWKYLVKTVENEIEMHKSF